MAKEKVKKEKPEKKKKEYKLDIFGKIINPIRAGKLDIWETLTEEERKEVSPYVLTMWMEQTRDPKYVKQLDRFVNPVIFNDSFKNRKDMLLSLFAVACRGQSWTKFFNIKRKTEHNKSLKALKEYYGYSTREAQLYLPLLDSERIHEIAIELGWQDDEINILKKELKA